MHSSVAELAHYRIKVSLSSANDFEVTIFIKFIDLFLTRVLSFFLFFFAYSFKAGE